MLYRYMHVPLWRVRFSSNLLWDRVYKSESLGLESGFILQDTDQLFKDFSLDWRETSNCQLKVTLCKFVDKNVIIEKTTDLS